MPEKILPQPMIAVTDVELSSTWWQKVLNAEGGHGGNHYERLMVEGRMVLQLHLHDEAHHHGTIGVAGVPIGNGVALWFEVDDVDAAAVRVRAVDAVVVTGLHVNPNAGHREIWFRDPDAYLVVFAGR